MRIVTAISGTHNTGMIKAFGLMGKSSNINTQEPELEQRLLTRVGRFKPDFVFLQIQRANMISPYVLSLIKVPVFIWTGDVRHPVPSFFQGLSQHATILFSNDTDTKQVKGSRFVNVGFQHTETRPIGIPIEAAQIVFMGTNYKNTFPLSNFRRVIVETLQNYYGSNFKLYGGNWGRGITGTGSIEHANKIYRGAKIGINMSHFDYSRYSSDRIFRIMGSGCFCLSHKYKDIEKDFKIGKHLDVFKDTKSLIERINYYLSADKKRNKIAKAGCYHVHINHKWENRVKQICEIYRSMKTT